MYSPSYGHQQQFSHAPTGPPLTLAGPSRVQQDGAAGPAQLHHFNLTAAETSSVGKPVHFTEGQFAGKTIRAELHEVQAAAFGRKYAKVDRRPLDPPPVAQLQLFEVVNACTAAQTEQELDYDNIHILGLMCTVELIPVPPPPNSSSDASFGSPDSPTYTPYSSTPSPPGMYAHSHTFHANPQPVHSHSPAPMSPQDVYSSSIPGSPSGSSVFGMGIAKNQKQTTALAGTTFVQVDSIPWKAKTSLLFTFADLAVKNEGYFVLQYRFFDIYSKPTGHADQCIQADCFGASFRIYSSKEVPPLGASTELTKHLARYGVRVNVRETERKRKKKEKPATLSSPFTMQKVPGADRVLSDGSDYDDD